MKRYLTFLLVIMALIITGCDNDIDAAAEESEKHMLVAYFSWSGNTKKVAEEISRQTGADLFEIIPEDPYPEDYQETIDRCHQERDTDARPKIDGQVENMEEYDTVFLGFPIWSSNLPAVSRTFLEQYDFSGKTIVPFCTHGGSGFASSLSTIEELVPEAIVEGGYGSDGDNAGNCSEEVSEWLQNLGYVD